MTLGRGKFRVRGDTIEVHPSYEETVLRIEMFGDTIEAIRQLKNDAGRTNVCYVHLTLVPYIAAGVVAFFVTIYLFVALLFPERF